MNIKKSQSYIHNINMNAGCVYELECDIDFFKELKKIITEKPSQSDTSDDTDTSSRCLITDEKLRKDHITLECGHKFNYIPLFKDVLFQKCSMLPKNLSSKLVTTYIKSQPLNTDNTSNVTSQPSQQNINVLLVNYNSSYNLEITKLEYNEIKCPYCRSITHKILPYYPYPDVCKVKYVNNPPNLALPGLTCEYDAFINGGDNTVFTTNENKVCRSPCIYNEKYDIMLCSRHFTKLESGTKSKSRRVSTSSSATNGTNTSPVPLQKSPPQTRSRASKKTNKITETIIETQNVIVSHHNPATTVCSFTLLSGPRKGSQCGKSIWIPKLSSSSYVKNTIEHSGSPAYCKVHYDKVYK